MRRLKQIESRTDDNRLVYIRVSNPCRADYTNCTVGAARFFEPSHRIFQSLYCYIKSKNARGNYDRKVYEFIATGRRGMLPPHNELRGIRYPCTPQDK